MNKEILFLANQFFERFEIPIFKDKRLSNLDIEQQVHRSKIPRLKDRLKEDDTEFHNREYLPDVGNMEFRVQMANKAEIDRVMDNMELYKNHEIYNEASNPQLFEITRKKREK